MSSIWFLCQTQQSKKEKRKKKNLILNNTKTWIEAIWETQQRKKIMRGKKVTVVGFGSEVAIGAKGEAFSGFDQKLLPHLCDLRCSSVLMQREKGFRVLRVASFKFQNAQKMNIASAFRCFRIQLAFSTQQILRNYITLTFAFNAVNIYWLP